MHQRTEGSMRQVGMRSIGAFPIFRVRRNPGFSHQMVRGFQGRCDNQVVIRVESRWNECQARRTVEGA